MPKRPRLLVTGFGPFPGMRRNPSAEIARRVAGSPRWRWLGIEARALVLATTYAALHEEFDPALRQEPLAAMLMIGVAGRSKQVRIEARALNRASRLLPDASARVPAPLMLAFGPAFRRSSIPIAASAVVLRRRGVRCRLSQDAGRYLCNAAYFRALVEPGPTLFLHIPRPPRVRPRKTRRPRPRLTWSERLSEAFVDVAVDLVRRGR